MKWNIRNTKKTGKRKLTLAACLFSIAYVLSGCGKGNENSEEQTSAYVYVAQQLATSSSGGYSLPEGFRNPAAEGGQIYYMRDTCESPAEGLRVNGDQMPVAGYTVERTILPEDGENLAVQVGLEGQVLGGGGIVNLLIRGGVEGEVQLGHLQVDTLSGIELDRAAQLVQIQVMDVPVALEAKGVYQVACAL